MQSVIDRISHVIRFIGRCAALTAERGTVRRGLFAERVDRWTKNLLLSC